MSLPGGLAEIASSGPADLRARLYDDRGALVAEADDRPGDWNFQIVGRFPAGVYELRLDAAAAPRAVSSSAEPGGGEEGPAPAPAPAEYEER